MNWIHLAMPWFYGAMDSELSTNMLMLAKKRGVFLVRLREGNELLCSIDYFDGMEVQQIDVDLDEEGYISNHGLDLETETQSLTEFVNYLHTFPLKARTKLRESVKLKGKVKSEEESFKRGESIKIKRFLDSTVTDKKDRKIKLENVDLSVGQNNSSDDENEKSIPLERSEIVKKTEQSIEITTSAGEKFELSTDGNIEKLLSIINYWRNADEVILLHIVAIIWLNMFLRIQLELEVGELLPQSLLS